jgi:hypothetical protein
MWHTTVVVYSFKGLFFSFILPHLVRKTKQVFASVSYYQQGNVVWGVWLSQFRLLTAAKQK